MARIAPDGNARLVFCPAGVLTVPAVPTAAQLNGGTVIDLTPHSLDWDFSESGQTTDVSDMASSFNKQDLGTYGGDAGSLTIYRHTEGSATSSAAWTALPRATRGHFVERLIGGPSATFAAAQTVSVYPGAVVSRGVQSRTRNTPITVQVSIAITGEPLHDIAVT